MYISEPVMDSVNLRTNSRRITNRILVEFAIVEIDDKKIVDIDVHKEYQYTELSNHDNEMVIRKVIKELRNGNVETTQSIPPEAAI